MIPGSLERLLQSPSKANIDDLLDDDSAVFLVDWRANDDDIVTDCETMLGTGSLSAELVEIDTDPGFEIHISYAGKRTKVPLVIGLEDRHITLLTLNQILAPDYEVRVCVDSNGGDTLAFLPLSAEEWATLESKYGERVARHFGRIAKKPNLFTDPW